MKRLLSYLAMIMLSLLGLSSCLKDNPYMDVSNTQPIIEFGQSAANGIFNQVTGYYGAFFFTGDTTQATVSTYDTSIALILASPQPLNDTIQVTVAVDTTQIAPWNASVVDTLQVTALPANLYTIPQLTINILPQHRVGTISVSLPVSTWPNPHFWGLPLTIVNAVDLNNPSNLIFVSGNSSQFMWIFTGFKPQNYNL